MLPAFFQAKADEKSVPIASESTQDDDDAHMTDHALGSWLTN